jgi:hypothetical protein
MEMQVLPAFPKGKEDDDFSLVFSITYSVKSKLALNID